MRLVLVDAFGSLLWFPAWWYTTGMLRVITAARRALAYRREAYGFRVWIRHFFVPMYGQNDLTGKLVSIFMRSIVLIGRAIAYVVEALVYVFGVLVWAAAPVCFLAMAVINGFRTL